jgi:hypothetical protein
MDGDMKKKRLCLILLCCFSVCMVAYHVYLWSALNSPLAEAKWKAAETRNANPREADDPVAETSAPAAEDQSFSEELRAVHRFEKNTYPALREAIAAAAGFDISVEVDWPSLAAEGWSRIYETAFPKVYFLPIIRALKSYAADGHHKNDARRFLKKIVIRNSGRYFSSNGISYADGALLIDHQPQANIDEEEDDRADRILELLIEAAGR